jgi:sigma-54 dependent transcriptional regulator, acetoin dehydrogenase operon transcriptional activator AcoR
MNSSDIDASLALDARKKWERFALGDASILTSVSSTIRASWLRSRALGVDMALKRVPRAAADPRTSLAAARLLRATEMPMGVLADALAGRKVVTLCADREGIIVNIFGNSDAIEHASEIGVVPGCQANESTIGTDAVPCALATNSPATVAFCEHYIEVSHGWSGSAAPIHRPFTNEMIGCVAIYGHRETVHPNALKLVVDVAAMADRYLLADEISQRFILMKQYESRRSKYPNDAFLCISRDGSALAGSSAAMRMLGYTNPVITDRGLFQVLGVPEFSWSPTADVVEIPLNSRRGDSFNLQLFPVLHQNDIAGFLGVLPENKVTSGRRPAGAAWRASFTFDDIVHGASTLADTITEATNAARGDWPVLITGESGCGKELFAQAIHEASPRRGNAFVAVNCGSISDELMSSELFGYVDGAFTGATRGGRQGKLELANGGTLFLDEAEAMSPRMQVHLLRVLEEGRVTPVGAEKPRETDVRIIAATNVDLEDKIKAGSFRRDLYYRLSVLSLAVPPLRERRADIPVLAAHFLADLGLDGVEPEAIKRLQAYCWPGNVRQLRNVLQQAALRASNGTITVNDLPATVCRSACGTQDCSFGAVRALEPEPAAKPSSRSVLKQAERDAIIQALRETEGNISRAATILGIHRITLHRKMEALEINVGRTIA